MKPLKGSPEMSLPAAITFIGYPWKDAKDPDARLAALSSHFKDLPLLQIGISEIEAYQVERRTAHVNGDKINSETDAIIAALTSADLMTEEIEDRYMPFVATLETSPLWDGKQGSGVLDLLTPVIKAAPEDDDTAAFRHAFLAVLGTAMMWEEFRTLKASDIDFSQRAVRVKAYRCVPERITFIRTRADIPDPLESFRFLVRRAARLETEYLLPSKRSKYRRPMIMKGLFQELRKFSKAINKDDYMGNFNYHIRALSLAYWPQLAITAGPGPDEYCAGMFEIDPSHNFETRHGWQGYYPLPGTTVARLPDDFSRDNPGNRFATAEQVAEGRRKMAMYGNRSAPYTAPKPPRFSEFAHPERQQITAPAPPDVIEAEPPKTFRNRTFEACEKASEAITKGISIAALVQQLKLAGIPAEKILDVITGLHPLESESSIERDRR